MPDTHIIGASVLMRGWDFWIFGGIGNSGEVFNDIYRCKHFWKIPWCIFYATMHERKYFLLDNKYVSRDLKWNLDDRTTNDEKIKRNVCCWSIWSVCSGYWRKRFEWYVMALFFLSASHFLLTIFLIASITSFAVKGLASSPESNLILCQIFDS